MKTVVIVHVHDGEDNSYSSKDFRGYRNFSSEAYAYAEKFVDAMMEAFPPTHRWGQENKPSVYVDKNLGIKLIYLPDYSHNRYREELQGHFENGDSALAKKFWAESERKENEKRQKQGFIYHKKFDDMKPADYIGNLSKSLTAEVKKYISYGHPAGYLGHYFRKFAHDKIIEKIVSRISVRCPDAELNKWELLGTWLTSSDARHWMDSVEDESLKEFTEAFEIYAETALTLGYAYGLDEHDGTMASTHELKAEANLTFTKEK